MQERHRMKIYPTPTGQVCTGTQSREAFIAVNRESGTSGTPAVSSLWSGPSETDISFAAGPCVSLQEPFLHNVTTAFVM